MTDVQCFVHGGRCVPYFRSSTMTTPADRFTRLEKVAVILIALGDERVRAVLGDLDLDTVDS